MNIKIISFLLLLVIILTTGCGETIKSTWKNQTLTIDGDSHDWEGLPYNLNLTDQKIKVGLEIVGMTEEEKDKLEVEMEERRSEMQDGNTGGRSGGGRRGGMRGSGNRGGGSMPKLPDMDGEEYWIAVKMAKK
jgi:uncharacterized membrane protein YgcG